MNRYPVAGICYCCRSSLPYALSLYMITDGFVNTKNYFSRQVSIIFYFFYRIRPKRAETDRRLRAVRSVAGAFAMSCICCGVFFAAGGGLLAACHGALSAARRSFGLRPRADSPRRARPVQVCTTSPPPPRGGKEMIRACACGAKCFAPNSPRCARPVQVFASSPPARKKGMTNVMPFRVLVEMIRLELTTYTLRTYRSTG